MKTLKFIFNSEPKIQIGCVGQKGYWPRHFGLVNIACLMVSEYLRSGVESSANLKHRSYTLKTQIKMFTKILCSHMR